MDFKILDASAFYAGIPFGSPTQYCTTSLVYDEISHIKKSLDAIDILIETKRLTIIDPSSTFTNLVIKTAKKTGDFNSLTKADISVMALCLNLKGQLITDDFAISNVAEKLELKVKPVMTLGIKSTGKWIRYCPGCHKNFDSGNQCTLCGNNLRRKLLKDKIKPKP